MASLNLSISLDVIEDRDLIDRLVPLQERKEASAEIRIALREHFGQQARLGDIIAELREVKELLTSMLSRGGSIQEQPSTPSPAQVAPSVSELEQKLDRTLSKFRH